MKKTALITGATGMVGGLVLKECLNNENIEKVISISRKPTGIQHDKLIEVIHFNFLDFTGKEDHFKNIDIAYFCIGVYTGAVSKEKFKTITVDYTKVFADLLKDKSPQARFCFLSGMGADQTEKSKMMFARDKGIAENYLIKKEFYGLHIFRPGYIYPVTPRKEPNFTYKLSRKLYPLLKILMPNGVITSEHLAKSMFKTGLHGNDQQILENKSILSIK